MTTATPNVDFPILSVEYIPHLPDWELSITQACVINESIGLRGRQLLQNIIWDVLFEEYDDETVAVQLVDTTPR